MHVDERNTGQGASLLDYSRRKVRAELQRRVGTAHAKVPPSRPPFAVASGPFATKEERMARSCLLSTFIFRAVPRSLRIAMRVALC